MMKRRLLSLCLSAALLLPSGAISALPANAQSQREAKSARAEIPQEIYEAEEFATAAVKNAADDYSGEGYVEGLSTPLSFKVDVPAAGNYGVRLRYICGSSLAGDGAKTLTVYANGQKVRQSTLAATINENTWSEKLENIPLNAGENTITYQLDSGDTASNVKIDLIRLSRIYEAEDAQMNGGMKVMSDHPGYSGKGFAGGFENSGEEAVFTVDAPVAGDYSLVLGYGNGDSSYARGISIFVNGEDAAQLSVGALRTWDAWGEDQATVTLKAGENKVSVKNDNDFGHINLDYITLKPCDWQYAGKVEKVEGNNTSQLTFRLDNAAVQISSVAGNSVKVWLEPSGDFSRKYESFAVVNDAVDSQKLKASDKGDYYEIDAGDMLLRVQKDPFKLTYLDKAGNVLLENENDSMAWSTDGELKVNNKIQADEHFWGLGSNNVDYSRRGERIVMWSCDLVGADSEKVAPDWDEGRSDVAEPYYISSKGYSVFFDNTSYTVFDMGKTEPDTCTFGSFNPRAGGELIYYFTYGPDLKQITKTFTDIIGKSFFAPDWAMGNMQCHWGYSQKDIENVAAEYRKRGIPLDVIISDIDWYEYLCSPIEWNKTGYPNPESMFRKLADLNVRYGLINDPNVTDRDNNKYFTDGDINKYFLKNQSGKTQKVNWPWGAASGLTDFFDPAARAWWGEQIKDLKAQGVDYIWMDMNEPSAYTVDWLFWNEEGKAWGDINEMKNAYATMHNKTLFDAMTEDGSRVIMSTRGGFTGSQKYAAPWTGDIGTSWQEMYQQINKGTGLSFCGYNYWGFDIGGFNGGDTDEQFKRWVQLATFTPVHRFHYTIGNENREAWTHNSEETSKKYINMRYRLMPYMYALTADNIIGIGIEEGLGEGGTGLPMTRPMVMNYSDDPNTYDLDTQYMMGDAFLVAPVVEESVWKSVYLPEGYWYDYDDGKTVYSGNQTMEYYAPVELLPVFVKEGSIIPMQPEMQYVGEKPVDEITLDVYPTVEDGDFHFVMYEDDGETNDYQKGVYTTTRYDGHVKTGDRNTLTLDIGVRTGSYADIDERDYMVQFHSAGFKDAAATLDGKALRAFTSLEALQAATEGYYVDIAANLCYVKLQDDAKAHTVEVSGVPYTDLTIQAEDCKVSGGLTAAAGSVTGFTADSDVLTVSDAELPCAGDYTVYIYYQTATAGKLTVSVDDTAAELPVKGGTGWQCTAVNLPLKQGKNTIAIKGSKENSSAIAIDRLEAPLGLITVPPISDSTVQAETGILIGNAEITAKDSGYTGDGYVKMAAAGDGVEVGKVVAMGDGVYTVVLRYANGGSVDGTLQVYVNGQEDKAQQVTFTKLNGWTTWCEAIVNLELKGGENTITFMRTEKDAGEVHIDRIICPLEPESFEEIPIVNGGFEQGNTNGWTIEAQQGSNDSYGVDAGERLAGDYKFYFFQQKSKRTISQTVNNLENGSYVVTAWVNTYPLETTTESACWLEVSGFDGDQVAVTELSLVRTWLKYEVPVEVKDGKLNILFRYQSGPMTSLQLDEISLRKVEKGTADSGLTQLHKIIDESAGLTEADYTAASWKNYVAALAMGRRIAADERSDIEDYAAAMSLIDRAKSALADAGDQPAIVPGDMDKDDVVTIQDVMEACKVLARKSAGKEPTADEMLRGNLDGDNAFTINDVMEICKILARKA